MSVELIVHADKVEPERVAEALRALGHDPGALGFVATRGPGDAERLARRAARAGVERVIAMGGDGTLNEVVNGLMSVAAPRPSLGLVPLGTANDFARAATIPTALEDALQLALGGEPTPLDLGRVGARWFANVVTGGVLSEASARVNPALKAQLGGLAYGLAGLFELPELEAIELSVSTAEGRAWTGEILALAVGNARFAGGGFELCPGARVDDGALDLTLFPATLPLSTLATSVLGRSAEGLGQLVRLRSASFTLEASRPLHVNADGEPLRGESLNFELAPRALRMCLGAEASVSP